MKVPIIDVIIPAFNEEKSIVHVIHDIPEKLVRDILVCNNNSTDRTKEMALQAGATVLDETRKGYGSACLKGLAYIENKEIKPDIVVFVDGDYSDYPQQLPQLIQPILDDDMEMVIGSRA
ncbi:MAG: glycosyltransferase family 2 protein, partial [Bacteroidia bacterium]|nr:glycosyltransferase family 2 protein [Bacteroidia bacterium]